VCHFKGRTRARMGDNRMFGVKLQTQEVAEICKKLHKKKLNLLAPEFGI